MFFGLNSFIKYILPKRLFYRALIIVAAPTIILQIIVTIVFYDSVWIKANKNITRSLVNQLKTIEEVYQNDKKTLTMKCKPKSGRGSFFYSQQFHEGAKLIKGYKYLLRTDLMINHNKDLKNLLSK